MSAFEVKDKVIEAIKSDKYDIIILNFANPDMVGHTGDYQAAVKAVEIVDKCVGKVVKAALARNGIALVTADHGNAEEMVDYRTRLPKTAHTKNPVEFIYVADDHKEIKLRDKGILADIAPTILHLLGIEKPRDMTARDLITR